MTLRLVTEHNLEFLGLKGGCKDNTCQNATLLEITYHSSIVIVLCLFHLLHRQRYTKSKSFISKVSLIYVAFQFCVHSRYAENMLEDLFSLLLISFLFVLFKLKSNEKFASDVLATIAICFLILQLENKIKLKFVTTS